MKPAGEILSEGSQNTLHNFTQYTVSVHGLQIQPSKTQKDFDFINILDLGKKISEPMKILFWNFNT